MNTDASGPGRICPRDYRYGASVFNRAPEISAEVLYVVGGLYGNLAAISVIEELASRERAPATIIFNGDFHWFDAEPGWFAEVDEHVARHQATRGNVETEIMRAEDVGAGCGCVYPIEVDDDVVQRSNTILSELRHAARATAKDLGWLAELPMTLVARVGALRIGIVHGDASSLAGWSFAHDGLADPNAHLWLNHLCESARVDVFASTHTCLAALRDFTLPAGRLTIINNGAAGMPNFAGSRFGLLSRIAMTPSPQRPVYGIERDGVRVDAIAIEYNTMGFVDRFVARWPEGSSAHQSYFRRIVEGPDHSIEAATGRPAAALAL